MLKLWKIYILNSLEGEWKDNKASLMEFMWAAHRGIKGMVTNHIDWDMIKLRQK